MEEKETKIKEQFYNKLSQYGATKKTLYSVMSILACVSLIVVLSLTQAQFSTTKFKDINYWVNFALLCGVCIFGMITGQQIGDDTSRNNPNGSFRVSLKKYSSVFTNIDSKKYFAYMEDWLDIFRDRKLKNKIESTLKDAGIFQLEVLDLDKSEIEKLRNPWKKEWKDTAFYNKYYCKETDKSETFFMSYTQEQIDILKFCMEGNLKVSKLPKSFFVSVLNQSGKDIWESAANSEKKKGAYQSISYIYKILGLLAMQIVLTGLQVGTSEGAGAGAVWLSMISRLSTMMMAIIWGMYVGFEIVKIDIVYLEFKTDILSQYYDEFEQGIYKPKTIEERAREEYEAKLLRQQISLDSIPKKEEVEDAKQDEQETVLG